VHVKSAAKKPNSVTLSSLSFDYASIPALRLTRNKRFVLARVSDILGFYGRPSQLSAQPQFLHQPPLQSDSYDNNGTSERQVRH
jgi:hypothetical protein